MDIDDFGIDLWSGVLSGAPLFEHVDLALLAPELHAGHELSLEAGHILLDPQHVNDNILMILKGELMVCLEPTVARPLVRLRGKRSFNHTLSLRREIWDAGVHVNKVDTYDGEQLRGIERFGGGAQTRRTLPL